MDVYLMISSPNIQNNDHDFLATFNNSIFNLTIITCVPTLFSILLNSNNVNRYNAMFKL